MAASDETTTHLAAKHEACARDIASQIKAHKIGIILSEALIPAFGGRRLREQN
jgi:hypothetical protein